MKEIILKTINDPELIIASIALFTSIVSILIGAIGLNIQRKHNRKSVLPFGSIDLGDYQEDINIILWNNGTGPMIIKSCITKSSSEIKTYPAEWIPDGIHLSNFVRDLEDQVLLPGNPITLLQYKVDINNQVCITNRDQIRSILKDLEIVIEFTDIYDTKFKTTKKLNWFGR